MAVLGLRFCARAFSSCGKWGPLFIAMRGPLIIAASLVAEHRLQTHRLSNCGSWAQLLRGMWDLPRPGLEPMSPALAGRFSTTAPPGKPYFFFFLIFFFVEDFLSSTLHRFHTILFLSEGYYILKSHWKYFLHFLFYCCLVSPSCFSFLLLHSGMCDSSYIKKMAFIL